MNQQQEPDELDRVLHQWASTQEPATDRLAALRTRIVEQLGEELTTRGGQTSEAGPTQFLPFHSNYLWFAAGAAAALLVMASVLWVARDRFRLPTRIAQTQHKLPADYTWLRQDHLRNQARLLADMKATFGAQLQWIAETGDRVELGLAQDAAPSGREQAISIRVVVERRTTNDSD